MTKRERLEDLGIILAKLERIEEVYEHLFRYTQSKHQYEAFQEHLKNDDNLYALHCGLRGLEDDLAQLWGIAKGDIE